MQESLRASLFYYRRDILSFIVLTLLVLVIFTPIMLRYSTTGDFPQHNQLALDLLANPVQFFRNTPHYLYHVLTAAVYLLVGDASIAGVCVMLFCYWLTAAIIYWQLRQASLFASQLSLILLAFVATLALLLIMPINVFTPENLYFGYFAPNVYHNPTVMLVKPFALLLFFMTLRLFGQAKPLSRWWILPFAFVTYLTLVAKPSFMLAYLPSLGLFCFFFLLYRFSDTLSLLRHPLQILRGFWGTDDKSLPQLVQRRYINWPVIWAGLVIPTFVILFIQKLTWTSSGGIGIEPFRLFNEWAIQYEPNSNSLLFWKLLMSCAFPLLVYLFYLPQSWRNLSFNLAWVFFAVSVAYAYLLVDYTDVDAGDFGWSAQIASFILYIVAAIFLMRVFSQKPKTLRQWLILSLCGLVFGLHLIAGLHWYQLHMSQDILQLIYIWW